MVTTSYRKEAVRCKVAHQDQVHQASEDKPSIVLNGSFVEGVIGPDLGLQLSLEEVVHLRVRILAGRWVDEDLRLLRPPDQGVMVRLVVKEPTYPNVITCTPEQIDCGEDGNSGSCG